MPWALEQVKRVYSTYLTTNRELYKKKFYWFGLRVHPGVPSGLLRRCYEMNVKGDESHEISLKKSLWRN